MNNKIPTAEEFLNKKQKEYSKGIRNSFKTNYELEKERLIEFAKLHVQVALEAAIKPLDEVGAELWNCYDTTKKAILESYPLTNII